MSDYPNDLRYTKDHEWARLEGTKVRVGVTAYAVESLGDVTMLTLPSVGSTVKESEQFGDIESVKAVSELFSPISGKVVEVNDDLESSPELVNTDPYTKGWLIVVELSNPSELESLMDGQAYTQYIKSLDH